MENIGPQSQDPSLVATTMTIIMVSATSIEKVHWRRKQAIDRLYYDLPHYYIFIVSVPHNIINSSRDPYM